MPDGLSAADTLKQFQHSRASVAAVRRLLSNTPLDGATKYNCTVTRSADAAVLLVSSYSAPGVCGVNYFNTVTSGNTLGTVRKGCALGYYSFAHEVSSVQMTVGSASKFPIY